MYKTSKKREEKSKKMKKKNKMKEIKGGGREKEGKKKVRKIEKGKNTRSRGERKIEKKKKFSIGQIGVNWGHAAGGAQIRPKRFRPGEAVQNLSFSVKTVEGLTTHNTTVR